MSSERRRSLFLDSVVQRIIEAILKRNPKELLPNYDPVKGFHYKEVDEATGGGEKSQLMLRQLEEAKILDKKFHDKAVVCPRCGSWRIGLQYRCPNCDSTNIEKKTLLEHVKCGAIDSYDHFKKNGRLTCPRCGVELTEDSPELRRIGSWFQCASCDTRFDEPIIIQQCKDCGEKFSAKDANLETLFSYALNEEAEAEYQRGFILPSPLKKKLEKAQYHVETPGTLKGSSGTEHKFDLVAWKNDKSKPIVIDVLLNADAVDEAPVAAMFAKAFDVKPKEQMLIAIPKLGEGASKLAQLYKINVVEATSMDEAAEKAVNLLEPSKTPEKKTKSRSR